MSRTDKALRILTAFFVAGLAIVAGAVSFSHMTDLALQHDQTGWKAYAFPISVDGLEIVASLFLVVQRRAGRPTGVIPWIALVVGTVASLAANVAVGGDDVIGKALAGWPALSMLVSVKLLFSMIDHVEVDQRTVRDGQPTADPNSAVPGLTPGTGADETVPSGTGPDRRTDHTMPSAARVTRPDSRRSLSRGHRAAPVDVQAAADLLPAARAARAALAVAGRPLSRDGLATAMRDSGRGVSNARASQLVKILKAEDDQTIIGPAAPSSAEIKPQLLPEAA